MGRFMKKTALLAALLFAWPLLGQNPPATNPPATNPPAQTPPAQNPPKLEQPPMAAPEPEEEKKPAPVKNEIITSSELDKARASAEEDARQECTGKCTPQQLQGAVEERQKSALR